MKTCYIICAGTCENIDIEKNNDDLIIAADAGLIYCEKFGVVPDIIVGDFDSLGYVPENNEIIKLPVEKDDTDTAFAVRYAVDNGYKKFVIFGGTGGKREDHTFANIALLSYISKTGNIGFLVSGEFTITAITNSKISFPSEMNGDISVFSFDENSVGVTERGLRYTLDNAELKNSIPIGVSNSFVGEESFISVENGTLIIYYSGKFSDCTIDKSV